MKQPLRRAFVLAALVLLSACATNRPANNSASAPVSRLVLPALKMPAGAAAPPSDRSNSSIARDFLDLSFALESGRRLPVLTRFEGPISLRVTGAPMRRVSARDLDLLLVRLNKEARIKVTRDDADPNAAITIELLPKKILRRTVPGAACFVAPNVSSWRAFTTKRNTSSQDWITMDQRRKLAIFLPADVSAQEIRDCLHEELAQALGPVNDLYRLTDSVFNDDNFQTVLTGFDMIVLRAYYDPALHSGMTSDEVAAKLPVVLNRINPVGRTGRTPNAAPTPQSWKDEIETALGSAASGPRQLTAIKRAVAIARAQGWNDNRTGFALYAQGRLALGHDSRLALASFAQASQIFGADPSTRLQEAHVAVQSAAYALSAGRLNTAIDISDEYSAVALRAENPGLLSSLLMIKATALAALGKTAQSDIVRLDALAWARYGLNTEADIRRRYTEISALAPRKERNPA